MALHDVVGHERPVGIIRRAIEIGRVHHAYLFTGMEGIGKKVVAMNMAKALNCERQDGDACDQCAACRRIDKGVYPDCITVNPDGAVIKIEQVRGLQQEIAFKPFEARWRVVIIDGAERLTRASANALLKTLEEPPPQTTLILIAAAIEGLPATVLSRCQRIRFTPLTDEEVKKVLANHLAQDQIDILVPLAAGSPGRAVQSDWQTVQDVKTTLGTAFAPSLHKRLQLAQDLAREEGKGKIFLELLEGWLRDIIVYQEVREEGRLLNRDLIDEIKRVAPCRKSDGLLQAFWTIQKIRQGIEAHGNLQLALESAFVTMEGA
ncbi:MAG: DNA polymerase III subunit delta' [Deltaproteobacteria bacterium RBG_16_54_18]|nr:MAG: DNA polymerase III subunit delta' [Deltaproteobacteria bacterium RBG_16_54_18]